MSVSKIVFSSSFRALARSKKHVIAAKAPQAVWKGLQKTRSSSVAAGPSGSSAFAALSLFSNTKKYYSTKSADKVGSAAEATVLNIKVDDGVYKLSLPITDNGSCTFTLKLHETVRDLIEDIRVEDPNVHTLMFKYADGLRVSHSTTVEDLLKSEFFVEINNASYKVPVLPDVVTEGVSRKVLSTNDIRSLMERAYFDRLRARLQADPRHHMPYSEFMSWCAEYGLGEAEASNFSRALHYAGFILHFADNSELSGYVFLKPNNVLAAVTKTLDLQYLRSSDLAKSEELKSLQANFVSLDKSKTAMEHQAERYATWMLRAGFVAICAQFFILSEMVWVYFNWDIMEPVTYFVFLSTLIIGYTFFLFSKQDYTYPALARRIANRRLRELFLRSNFNWAKWNNYKTRIDQLKSEIGVSN